MDLREISRGVAEVIEEVRRRGDEALLEYTRRWDRADLRPECLRVPSSLLEEKPEDSAFAGAFARAAERIRRFHERVRPASTFFEDDEGVWMGIRWTPLRSVGLYVPGGKASYPSTLAMTAVPAQIAGVERIVVVSPPGPDGEVSEQVLLAARVLGLGEVYRVGGAQAIAALALGTETVPRVDKIFGPGNAFVAEAKKQLFGEVGIDLIAGPSELVVYADETAEPEWVAADLAAQAEHDEETRVTLLASSDTVLDAVRAALVRRAASEPRRATIEAALERNGRFEVVRGAAQAAERIDGIAPEHLSLQVADPWRVLSRVRNAGAIFLGKESPVAVGDYYAGPNHVLPTGSTARFASCLSVEDFMKRSNVARMGLDFLRRRGGDVEELAEGERLPAHAASVRVRRGGDGRPRPRPGLQAVTPYLLVEEEGEVKLNQNESPFDVPHDIKDEVARRLRDLPWNRYHQKLPAELCARIAADAGVPETSVIAASGSNLLLQWIFEAYAGPGRTILVPHPSFSLYPLWAGAVESRLESVALEESFEYSAERWIEAIGENRPALAVLCLPNNPTGSELDVKGVEAIADAAARAGTLVVVDEAYREFSDPRFDRSPLVRRRENVILVRTCSKAFSAAGMRLGYLLAPEAVATELRKLVPPFHLSLFSAVLGLVLWERRETFRERILQLLSERDRMMKRLEELPGIRVFPTQANFFLLETARAGEIQKELRARGILVRRPGEEPPLERCLRVNAGTAEENERFLQVFEELVRR